MPELTESELEVRAQIEQEWRAKYDTEALEKLGKEGKAFKNPDGHYSYPIDDEDDLSKAIRAVGRGGASHDAIRAYIVRRAKAMGLAKLLPEDWPGANAAVLRDNVQEGEDDAEKEECPTCDGTGKIRGGEVECPDCNGTGELAGGPTQENSAETDLERRALRAKEREGMVEYRSIPSFELRDTSDGHVRFSGYASTTEAPYEIADFTETIARGAFKRTLGEEPDVRLNINHGVGGQLPLARTKSGTLTLMEDARGLKVQADLDPNDPDVRSLLPKMRRGDVDEMSFAFRATGQEWNDDYSERTIKECALHRGDVSIVTTGANPDTSAIIRSDNGEFELRVGRKVSQVNEAVVKTALEQFEQIDKLSDKGQEELSGMLGVENPDEDAEDKEGERQSELKITVSPRRSYLEIAKARRARLLP